ncbi:Potassium voltage-gated channel subfamily H member 6 [Symbiodinium microadriaticum]|uniref:Potassium voltage-gated channel subfamily H member 6 n=1 Tax=Symbiodinium microadriaticum TaxID=2951 RepID=A0A1Q9C3T1_SYMMI|nr:Potassium voltage-gated channel subfamily H member 6 [Symbiodinium microadriaticum]CAE7698344.1 KCNH7 [Symbiodinium microadriaticum]
MVLPAVRLGEYVSRRLEEMKNDVFKSIQVLLAEQLNEVCKDLESFATDQLQDDKKPEAEEEWEAEIWKVSPEDSELDWPAAELSDSRVASPAALDDYSSFESEEGREVSFHDIAEKGDLSEGPTYSFGTSPLHQIWNSEDLHSRSGVSKSSAGMTGMGQDFVGRLTQKSTLRSGMEVQEHGRLLQKAVMRPGCKRCLVWDAVCIIAIVHDALMIPVLSAFPIERVGLPRRLEIASSIIWTMDLFVTFLRGFLDVRTGFVEMRIRNIAWNYITHWFVADLSMIVIDAVSLFAFEDDTLEALTLLRLLRNIRLLRLLKMSDRFTLLREIFSSLEYELEWTSVYLATFMGILQHLGVIALLCHFTGCAWYGLGGMTTADATWVKDHAELRGLHVNGSGGSVMYMYATSVHWSLTQFTPAAMDVVATNTPERIFSVVICLGGLIAFSFFLGTINQSFAKLRSLTAQDTRQRKLVRRYVADKHVSADLSSEILACIRQRGLGKAMGKIVFSDIKAFESLPHKLMRRLQEEVGIPVLEKHGMFKYLTYLSISDVSRTCHSALTEQSIVYGEEVFQAGSVSTGMYLLQSGHLAYTWEASPHILEDVLPDQRASEAALWVRWEHRGRMACADQSCHLFQVSLNAFHKIMDRSDQKSLCAMYARNFSRALEDHDKTCPVTDLFGDDEIVTKLLQPIRIWQAGIISLMPTSNSEMQARAAFLAWKSLTRTKRESRSAGKARWHHALHVSGRWGR